MNSDNDNNNKKKKHCTYQAFKHSFYSRSLSLIKAQKVHIRRVQRYFVR